MFCWHGLSYIELFPNSYTIRVLPQAGDSNLSKSGRFGQGFINLDFPRHSKHELSLQLEAGSHMSWVLSMRIFVACIFSIVECRFQLSLCGLAKPGVFGYPEREDSLQQPDHERREVELTHLSIHGA